MSAIFALSKFSIFKIEQGGVMKQITFTGVYDNPYTIQRELWFRSKVIATANPVLFMQKAFSNETITPWKSGQIINARR